MYLILIVFKQFKTNKSLINFLYKVSFFKNYVFSKKYFKTKK